MREHTDPSPEGAGAVRHPAGECEHILQSELEAYGESGIYPMHMPGHKRNLSPAPGLPYAWDVTEVEGMDDLHHPKGILKEAMERTAALWGSRRTWYLVGGSTCGVLASLYAAVPSGGEVIAARNCHKSVFHALELQNIRPHWIVPRCPGNWDIFGSISPDAVEKLLKRYPASAAVILTSPTYEGVVSDIAGIAEICHCAGVPLIVDEAHGAHFGLFRTGHPDALEFPESALHLGADLVIQSAHKTLPSLTQTAFLHMGEHCRISGQAVEHGLDLYETSSPSYPLMASLDGCTGLLRERGPELFRQWEEGIRVVERTIPALQNLEVFRPAGRAAEEVYDYDRSRFLVRAEESLHLTGKELADLFREQYGIESEMHSGRNVLLMTGCGDTVEGLRRLAGALQELDAELARRTGTRPAPSAMKQKTLSDGDAALSCEMVLPIGEAVRLSMEHRVRQVLLQEAAGHISGEYVMAYPPGIPILIPGERITDEAIRVILSLAEQGSNLVRSFAGEVPEDGRYVAVLSESSDREEGRNP